jgi:hypothetical protein
MVIENGYRVPQVQGLSLSPMGTIKLQNFPTKVSSKSRETATPCTVTLPKM